MQNMDKTHFEVYFKQVILGTDSKTSFPHVFILILTRFQSELTEQCHQPVHSIVLISSNQPHREELYELMTCETGQSAVCLI